MMKPTHTTTTTMMIPPVPSSPRERTGSRNRYLFLLLFLVGGSVLIHLLDEYGLLVMKVVIVVVNNNDTHSIPPKTNDETLSLAVSSSRTIIENKQSNHHWDDRQEVELQEATSKKSPGEEEEDKDLDDIIDEVGSSSSSSSSTSSPSSAPSSSFAVIGVEDKFERGGEEEEEESIDQRLDEQQQGKPTESSHEDGNEEEEEKELDETTSSISTATATATATAAPIIPDSTVTTTTTAPPPSCPNYGYTQGKWIKMNNNTITVDHVSGVGDNGAAPQTQSQRRRLRRGGRGGPTKPFRYEWSVSKNNNNCQLVELTRENFCKALNGRNLMLVGDSLNHQFYEVLKTFLGAKDIRKLSFKGRFQFMGEGTICHASSDTKKNKKQKQPRQPLSQPPQQKLSYWRSDHLGTNTHLVEDPKDLKATYANQPWVTKLSKSSSNNNNQVVLLNTGAHVAEARARGRDPLQEHRQSLTTVQSYFQSIHYKGTVLYRTTPRGHIGCTQNDTDPIASEREDDWDRFFSSSSSTTQHNNAQLYEQYGYDIIPQQNEIYRELFESSQLLDVARMTELRPDGHSNPVARNGGKGADCLHYNPDDQHEVFRPWIWLLQNALLGNL